MAGRRQFVLFALVAAALLQGCALRATGTTWRPAPVPQRVVEVFYATDRAELPSRPKPCPSDSEWARAPRFGSERNNTGIAFGRYAVQLPAGRQISRIVKVEKRPACLAGAHELYLRGPAPQEQREFFQAVADAAEQSPSKDILVFVHGYNYKFDEAVLWAAQLKNDSGFEGVQVLYSWPSRGSKWSYATDSGNAEWTTAHLKEFLDQLAEAAPGARIHLLAHSMGNRPLLYALNRLATEQRSTPVPRFGQIILAAPDVDQDVFRQLIGPVLDRASRITLYTSAKDSALGASGWLFSHPRAGDSEYGLVLIPGMDTVDVTAVDTSRARHDYFLENKRVLADIFQLLRHGAAPADRFALFRVETDGGVVWQFRP